MKMHFVGKAWLLIPGLLLVVLGISLKIPTVSNAVALKAHEASLREVALFLTTDANLAFDIGSRGFGLETYDIPLARKAFEKTVALQPDMLNAHYQLARVLFVEGKFGEALGAINKELEYNPNNLRSLYVRGLIYAYSNRLALAEDDFERFVAWVPTEWAGHNDLAWVLGQEGKYREAKEVMRTAFTKAHDAATNPWLWNTLGVQELNLGEYTEAVHSFQKAQELASRLDEKTWRAAYPGNDPSSTAGGLEAFRDAIETNLAKAKTSQ